MASTVVDAVAMGATPSITLSVVQQMLAHPTETATAKSTAKTTASTTQAASSTHVSESKSGKVQRSRWV
jgi:hypothetical protein